MHDERNDEIVAVHPTVYMSAQKLRQVLCRQYLSSSGVANLCGNEHPLSDFQKSLPQFQKVPHKPRIGYEPGYAVYPFNGVLECRLPLIDTFINPLYYVVTFTQFGF